MEDSQILARETSSEAILRLTERLINFVPHVEEVITRGQDEAIKQATMYFYKQLLQKQAEAIPALVSCASGDICRICREVGSKENLIEPCLCRGTMRFIHLSCLERWLAESDSTRCELCSHQYETIRTPKYGILKSVLIWLWNPGRRRETREIIVDTLALIVFSPMAFLGTYMALVAADNLYTCEETIMMNPLLTKMVTLGCIGVIGAIDTAYLSWFIIRVQYHARSWKRWWRRNSIVRVILPAGQEKLIAASEQKMEDKTPSGRS